MWCRPKGAAGRREYTAFLQRRVCGADHEHAEHARPCPATTVCRRYGLPLANCTGGWDSLNLCTLDDSAAIRADDYAFVARIADQIYRVTTDFVSLVDPGGLLLGDVLNLTPGHIEMTKSLASGLRSI